MIQMFNYWRGCDMSHAEELTDEIRGNAEITVAKVNELLERSGYTGINTLNSGWRPQAVNDRTANSGKNSKHISGQAADIPDPDGSLGAWCLVHLGVLDELGLFMEDTRWTPIWVHVQIVPPLSGLRVYVPSNTPPLV